MRAVEFIIATIGLMGFVLAWGAIGGSDLGVAMDRVIPLALTGAGIMIASVITLHRIS